MTAPEPFPPRARQLLEDAFRAAVAAAAPAVAVPKALPERRKGRVVVLGAGKASAQMAEALVQAWDGPLSGVVVTRTGHGTGCETGPIEELIEASQPTPDAASEAAAERIQADVAGLGPEDLVIALMSGGRLGAPVPAAAGTDAGRQTERQLGAFAAVDQLFITDPTGIDVNDFRAFLVD